VKLALCFFKLINIVSILDKKNGIKKPCHIYQSILFIRMNVSKEPKKNKDKAIITIIISLVIINYHWYKI
jgi:hypothetical protein